MASGGMALSPPCTGDVQHRIIENFGAAGFDCVAEAHLDISDNFSFSEVGTDHIHAMCRAVAESAPEAIAIICTNLAGAGLAPQVELETGIAVYDSISVVVMRALELAGRDPAEVTGWGRIFAQTES